MKELHLTHTHTHSHIHTRTQAYTCYDTSLLGTLHRLGLISWRLAQLQPLALPYPRTTFMHKSVCEGSL